MSTLSVSGAYCKRENPDVRERERERESEREREGERGGLKETEPSYPITKDERGLKRITMHNRMPGGQIALRWFLLSSHCPFSII